MRKIFPKKPLSLQNKSQLTDRKIPRSFPGFIPFERGLTPLMYINHPWTIRESYQLLMSNDLNENDKQHKETSLIDLSVSFDRPTELGYDSDKEQYLNYVGKNGLAVDSIEDMKRLFDRISINNASVLLNTNRVDLPIFALYVAAANELGISIENLDGMLQTDIMDEFIVKNKSVDGSEMFKKVIGDIISFCKNNMPNFTPFCISAYQLHEKGVASEIEIALMMLSGIEYIKTGIEAGHQVDEFAHQLSFKVGVGIDLVTEMAKIRASRIIWSKIMQQFNPKNKESFMFRAHCHTTSSIRYSKLNLAENIARKTTEALTAILGQIQSLEINEQTESVQLHQVHANIQLILQHECGLTNVVDPFGGSYIIEQKTYDLVQKAWEIITDIEQMGGITLPINKGILKLKIEEAVSEKTGDSEIFEDTNLSANKSLATIQLDPSSDIRDRKINQLNQLKNERNVEEVTYWLEKLKEATKTGEGNLLEIAIECAKVRATLEEISTSLLN